MATFLFSYRMPADYQAGRPDAIANWTAFFKGLGDHVVDQGRPVAETAELGDCGAGTRPGGYSLISADDLEAAVALAQGCPALAEGAGVQVGVLTDVGPAA
ncbi:MAG: hypothetical protein QOG05_3699 [Streptosporangiaceae bacterium]|jgi:hypothetical protein|nr:hypothetical protein [Streptosporangiaceae bacterium]